MDRVFVDTDIVLDLLMKRMPYYTPAAHLFSKADKRQVDVCASSLTFANAHYILRRQLPDRETRKILTGLKSLIRVLPITDKTIELALTSHFADFEDAIQYHAASENGVQIFITRNLRDYKLAKLPVMNAEAYLKKVF